MGVRETREKIGERINAAHYLDEPTIVERNGRPYAVIVSYAWWAERQGQSGQGTLAP
jgi:prevent-host-death family protein